MPLTALTRYGKELVERDILPRLGWSRVKAPYALVLNEKGELTGIRDLRVEEETTKKKVFLRSPELRVPYRDKHTSAPTPFFLCDTLGYLLGIFDPARDDEPKVQTKHERLKELHLKILKDVHTPEAKAVKAFFSKTFLESELADNIHGFKEMRADILMATSIAIIYEPTGEFVHEEPEIAKAWDAYYFETTTATDGLQFGTCLLTGDENVPLARLHPNVTGVPGAQSSGACLVSFGTDTRLSAYNYFDKKQGMNAPTSITAAEYYGNAIRYLLKSRKHCRSIDDTHVLFWAEHDDDNETVSDKFYQAAFGGSPWLYSEDDDQLFNAVSAVLRGYAKSSDFDAEALELTRNFHIMTIRPHAARLAITQYQTNTFGDTLDNIAKHYARAEIYVGTDKHETMRFGIPDFLEAISNPKGKRMLSPNAAEVMVQAVLNDKPYPPILIDAVLGRIRVEKTINAKRASLIKAFLLKNSRNPAAKDVATVSLNTTSDNPAYLLGRLFWTYELIQKDAMGSVNVSIKDRYFSIAAQRPAQTFNVLRPKMQAHMKKIEKLSNKSIFRHNMVLAEIADKLGHQFPATLTTEEQSIFYLGYYHAQKDTYTKKPKATEK